MNGWRQGRRDSLGAEGQEGGRKARQGRWIYWAGLACFAGLGWVEVVEVVVGGWLGTLALALKS